MAGGDAAAEKIALVSRNRADAFAANAVPGVMGVADTLIIHKRGRNKAAQIVFRVAAPNGEIGFIFQRAHPFEDQCFFINRRTVFLTQACEIQRVAQGIFCIFISELHAAGRYAVAVVAVGETSINDCFFCICRRFRRSVEN